MAAPRLGSPAYQDQWRLAYWNSPASTQDKQAVLGGWTPRVSQPPGGMYDPSLDQQLEAGRRGYGDLLVDSSLARQRGQEDVNWARGGIQRTYDRGAQDYYQAKRRGQEDHNRNIEELQRQFRLLGNRQGQQMRAYGVSRGGAALQAARKRAENEGRQRTGIELQFNRFNEDADRGFARLGEDTQLGFQELDRGWGRQQENQTLQVDRAGRELSFSGLDTDAIKRFQAVAAGWRP